jgi:hypothetical protein
VDEWPALSSQAISFLQVRLNYVDQSSLLTFKGWQFHELGVSFWAMGCRDSTGIHLSRRLVPFLCHNLIPELLNHKSIWSMSSNYSI